MDIEINRLTEIEIYTLNPLTGEPDDEHAIWVDDESEVRIEAGSLHLTNAIADTDLKFGQLIAGEFEVTLFNLETDVAGRYIKVWVTENNVRSELFTGKIDSAEHDNVNKHRKITAYDWAYYNRDINVADFWNDFWETNKEATTVRLDWFRSQLLDHLGIMGSAGSLYNDSLNIAGQYDKVTVLTFESLLIMISELQCALPHINAGGAMDFITLDDTNTADLRTNKIEGDSSKWEDYTVQPISGIAVWEDSNNMKFHKGNIENNPYNISGNLFLKSLNNAESIVVNLLPQMTGFSYVPCSLHMIVSDLNLELGQRVRTDKGYSYIMSNEIFGSMWVEQTLECRATSGTRPLMGETYNDNMTNGLKTAKIEKNIDELSIQYTNVKNQADQLGTDISIIAGRVVMKVNKNGKIASMRLDADPDSTTGTEFTVQADQINLDGYDIVLNGTHGITITSPNFNVTSDGTIQAVKGLIGGLTIHNNNISTEDSGEYSVSQDEWEPWENVDGEGHNGYRSFSNWHENNKDATATISFEGYDTFVVVIRSDAEGRYDYTMASGIGVETFTRTSPYVGTTKGNQNANVVCTYSGLNGLATTIKILYTKDSSSYSGADRGYFYIDESACVRTSEASNFKLSATDFSRVINGQTRDHLRLAIGNKFGVNVDGTLYADIGEFNGSINVNNKFIVDSQGNMTSIDGTLTGGSINIGNGTFVVDSNGNLTATSATIKGAIEADQVISMKTNASTSFASQTFNVLDTTIDAIQPGLQFNGPAYSSETDSGKIFVYLPSTYGNTLNFYKHIFLTGNYAFGSAKLMTGADITSISYGLLFASSNGYIGRSNFTASDIKGLIDSKVTANPSGTATTALTKLTVGSTIYSVGGTNVVANPSGSASTELAKLTVGSTTYSVSRVSANPPLAGSTTLQRIQIDGTTYEMPSGGGGSVGDRQTVKIYNQQLSAGTPKEIGSFSLPKDGVYLVQATIKFQTEADIEVGLGPSHNSSSLQTRAYGSDKISVSRIITSSTTGATPVYIFAVSKIANTVLQSSTDDTQTTDMSIIEYIKLK